MSPRVLFHHRPPEMRTPSAQLDSACRALRNTRPESLATAAKTSIRAEFIRGRLDLPLTKGLSLTVGFSRTHALVLSSYRVFDTAADSLSSTAGLPIVAE